MRQAARFAQMRSSHNAAIGRRLLGVKLEDDFVSGGPYSSADRPEAPGASRFAPGNNPEIRARADIAAPSDPALAAPRRRAASTDGAALSIALGDETMLLFRLLDAHFGVSAADTLTRAICALADKEGIAALADAGAARMNIRRCG